MPARSFAAPVLAAATLAVVPAAATAAQTTLATAPAVSPVTAYGTTVAWSALDPATGQYALSVSIAGQQQTPPVSPRTVPFDVDAGLGPDGATWLVYSRCRTEGKNGGPGKGCDLYGYSLAGGATEVKLAASGSSSETEPAISGNRVVFARGGAVYAGPVEGSGAPRKIRGAVPVKTCDTISGRCVAFKRPQVQGLDLSGKRVAAVSYWNSPRNADGVGQTALVLAPVSAGGRPRAVAYAAVGMNGQSLLGPSLAGNAVGWFYGCPGLGSSCGGSNAGSWLYDRSAKRWSLARSSNDVQSYAALPDNQAIEMLAGTSSRTSLGCGFQPNAAQPCSIVQVDGLSYKKAKTPKLPIRLAS